MLGHQITRSPNLEVSFKLPRAAAKDLWHLAKCGDAKLKDIGILKVQIRELHSANPDEFLSWNGRKENGHKKGFEDWSYKSLRKGNGRRGIQSQYEEESADYHGDIPTQWSHQREVHAPPHYTLYNSPQPPNQTLREKNEYRQRSGHVAEKEVHKTKIIGISRGVLTNETIPIDADFLGPTPGWLLESALCISFRRHGKCEVACQTGSEKINYRPRPGSSRYEQSNRMEMATTELLSDINGRYKVYTDKIASEKELSDELRSRKSTSKDGSFTQCSSESIRILESLANSLENANEKAGTGISGEYPTTQMYEQNLREPVFYEGQNDVVRRQPRQGYNPDQRYSSGMQEIGYVKRPARYSENEGLLSSIERQNVPLDYPNENRGGRVNPYTASQAAEFHRGKSRQERDAMVERSAMKEKDSSREGYREGDPAQVFGTGTLRDYLEREKEIYQASKKESAKPAQKSQWGDDDLSGYSRMGSPPARRPSAHESHGDEGLYTRVSEGQESRARNIDSNQMSNSGHSSNQMGYSGQSLPISVSLDGDYLRGIAARGREEKESTKRRRTRRVPSSSQDYVGEDEYFDDETYSPYQVKRKRGRPPKPGVQVEQSKKRRGRPPKTKPVLTDAGELPLETRGAWSDAMRISAYPSAADIRRMSSVSSDSQDIDWPSFGQEMSDKGEYLIQETKRDMSAPRIPSQGEGLSDIREYLVDEAKREKGAPKISSQGEVLTDTREYLVDEVKQDKRASRLPLMTDLPMRAITDDLLVLDTGAAAKTKSEENQAISDRSMNQVISDEDVIELSSNDDHPAFSPVQVEGSDMPEMISPAAKDSMTADGSRGDIFFGDQAKKQPIHVDTLEKGYRDKIIKPVHVDILGTGHRDKIMKTIIIHNEDNSRDSENSLASPVEANVLKIKDFPKEISSLRHLTPGSSRSSSPIDRTTQIDLEMKVRSRRHRWYQKDTLHRDIEEAYTRMYPSVSCETEQLMPEDVYYGENYPIIFADDDQVMMKFVDMSTAFKLAMKESAAKKQRTSSTELVIPSVSHKEGKKTSERRRSSVQSLTDIHESEDTKIEASVIAKMQKRRAVVTKKPSKPNPPAKRKSIEADSDSDFLADRRKETRLLDADSSQKPSHRMSLRPRRVLNLGEEYLSSDSFEEEFVEEEHEADTGSVYESGESSDSEPLINKVRKSSTSSATKVVRKTLSEKIEAVSGEGLKTFVDNAARQTTQHIESVLGNMPTGMIAKISSDIESVLGNMPTGMTAKTSSESFTRNSGPTGLSARTPRENFGENLGPSRNVPYDLMQVAGSNIALKESCGNTLGPSINISQNLPQAEASNTSKQSLVHVSGKKLPGLHESTEIRPRDLKSNQREDLSKTEKRSAESAVRTTSSNRDTVVISFDDLIANEAFSLRKKKRERKDSPMASTEKSDSKVSFTSTKDMIGKNKKEMIVDLTGDNIVEIASPVANKAIVPLGDSGSKRDYLVETSCTLKATGDTIEVIKEKKANNVQQEEIASPDNVTSEISNTEIRVRPSTGDKHTEYVKGENQRLDVSQHCHSYKDSLLSGIKFEALISHERSSSSSETFVAEILGDKLSSNSLEASVVDVLGDEKVYAVKGRTEPSKVFCEEMRPPNDSSSVGQERKTSELAILGEIEKSQPYVVSKSQSGKHNLVEDSEPKKFLAVEDVLQGEAMKEKIQGVIVTSKDQPDVSCKSQSGKQKLTEVGDSMEGVNVAVEDILQGEAMKGDSQKEADTRKELPEVTSKSQSKKPKLEEEMGGSKKDLVAVLQGEAKKGKNQKESDTREQDIVPVEEKGSGKVDEKANEDGVCITSIKAENVKTDSGILTKKSKANSHDKSTEGTVFPQTEELIKESVLKDTSMIKDASVIDDTSVIKDSSVIEDTLLIKDASVIEDTSVIKDASVIEDTSVIKDASVIEDTSLIKDTSMTNATASEKNPIDERSKMQHVSKESTVDTIKVTEDITNKELMDKKDTEVEGQRNTVKNTKSNTSNDLSSKEVMVLGDASSGTNDTQTMLEKHETESLENITDIATDITTDRPKERIVKESTVMSSEIKIKDVAGSTVDRQEGGKVVASYPAGAEPAAPKQGNSKNNKNTEATGGSKITNLIKRSIRAISDTLSKAKIPKLEADSMHVQKTRVKGEGKDEKKLQESEGNKEVAESFDMGKQGSQKEENVVLTSNLSAGDRVNVQKTQAKRERKDEKNLQESEGNKEVAESFDMGEQGLQKEENVVLASNLPKLETDSMNVQKTQDKRGGEDEKSLQDSKGTKDVAESVDKGKQGLQKDENVVLASNLPKLETDSMNVQKTQDMRGEKDEKNLHKSKGNKEVAESVDKGKQGAQKDENVVLSSYLTAEDRVKKEVRQAQISQPVDITNRESSKPSIDSKASKTERLSEVHSATDTGSAGLKKVDDKSPSKAACHELKIIDKQKSSLQSKSDAENDSLDSKEQITDTNECLDSTENVTVTDRPLCLTSKAGGVYTDFKAPVNTISHVARQEDGALRSPLVADEAPKFDTIVDKSNTIDVIDSKDDENDKNTSTLKVQRSVGEKNDLEFAVDERIFEEESPTKVSEMLIADKAPNIATSGDLCSQATAIERKHSPITTEDSEVSAKSMETATAKMPGILTESGDARKPESCNRSGMQQPNSAERNSSTSDLVANTESAVVKPCASEVSDSAMIQNKVSSRQGSISTASKNSENATSQKQVVVANTGNAVLKPCVSEVSSFASKQSQVSARKGSISTPSKNSENATRQVVPQASGSSPVAKNVPETEQSPSAERHIEEMDAAQCLLGLFNSDQPSQTPIKMSGQMSTKLQQGESTGREKNTRDAKVALHVSKPEVAKETAEDSKLLLDSEREISSREWFARKDKDVKPQFQSVTTSPSVDKSKTVVDHDCTADDSSCEILEASKSSPSKSNVSDGSEATKTTGIFRPQTAHQKDKTPSKNSENTARQNRTVPQGSGSSPVAHQKSLPASQTARNIFECFKFEQPSESVAQNADVELGSSRKDRKGSSSDTRSLLESTTLGHKVGKEVIIMTKNINKKQEGTKSDKVEQESSKTDTDHREQKAVVPEDSSTKPELLKADSCETKKRVVEAESEKQEETKSDKVEQRSSKTDTDLSKVREQKVVVPKDNSTTTEIVKADSCETKKRVVEVKSAKHEGAKSDKVEQESSKTDTDHSKVREQKVVVPKDNSKTTEIVKADSCETKKRVVEVKSAKHEGAKSDKVEQESSKTDTDHSKVREQKVAVPKDNSKTTEIVKADSCETKKRVVEAKSEQNSSKDVTLCEPGNIFENMGISESSGERKEHSKDSKEKGSTSVGKQDENHVFKETLSTVAGDVAAKKRKVSSGETGAAREEEFTDMEISGTSEERKGHCEDNSEKDNTNDSKEDKKKETILSIAGDVAAKKRKVSSGETGDVREKEFEDCKVKVSLGTKPLERKQKSPADQFLHDSKMQSHEEDIKLSIDKSTEFGQETQKSGQTDISRSGQPSPDKHKSGKTSSHADISLYANERFDVTPDSQSQEAALRDEIVENTDTWKAKENSSEIDKKGSEIVHVVVSDMVKDSGQTCIKNLEVKGCSSKPKEDVVCSEKPDDRASQLTKTSKKNTRDLNPKTTSETTNLAPSAKVSTQYLDGSFENMEIVEVSGPADNSGAGAECISRGTENEAAEVLEEISPAEKGSSSQKPDNDLIGSLDNHTAVEPLEPLKEGKSTAECTTKRTDNEGQASAEVLEEVLPAKEGSSAEKPDTGLASGPKDERSDITYEKHREDKDCHLESDESSSISKERSGTLQGKGNSSHQESETKRRHREKKRKSADLELLGENKNVLTRGRRRQSGSPAKRLRSSRS